MEAECPTIGLRRIFGPARFARWPRPHSLGVKQTTLGVQYGMRISRNLIIHIIVTLLVTLCIRVYLVQAYRISSNSMAPELLEGDHVLVNKLALFIDDPVRGDVVFFNIARDRDKLYAPDRRPDAEHLQYVKRVIGLPGEMVEIRERLIYINGVPEIVEDTNEAIISSKGERTTIQQAKLLNASYRLLNSGNVGIWPSKPLGIEPGRYFFLGDNRGHSYDSRHFGTVRRDAIVGKGWFIYFSIDPETSSIRWDRIGRRLR